MKLIMKSLRNYHQILLKANKIKTHLNEIEKENKNLIYFTLKKMD